jgi:FMN phosphatase YigB (HAD superfamily)
MKLAMLSDSDGIKGLKRKRINQLGLEPYFDVIITSDDIGENKPSPKGFYMALALLKVSAAQCVMVGDHPEFDLVPAKQLGIKTVWTQERIMLDRDFPFVDYKIRKIEELLNLPLF